MKQLQSKKIHIKTTGVSFSKHFAKQLRDMDIKHDAKEGIQGKGCVFHMDYSETKGTDEELAKLLSSISKSSRSTIDSDIGIGFALGCKLLCEREPDADDKTKQHQLKPEDVDMLAKDIRRWLWFEEDEKQYPIEHYRKIVRLFIGTKYQRKREK